MNKHTTASILALLCCFLLTSCATAFWKVPYYAGSRGPLVRLSTGQYSVSGSGVYDLDIHRIGGAYYAKIEVFYFPYEKTRVLWNFQTGYPLLCEDTTKKPIQCTYYCLLNEAECAGLHLPALPTPQPGAKPAPAVLTDRAAAKLQPEHVCMRRDCQLPESIPCDTKHSLIHYPLLPVSAAAFVAVDLPSTVVFSIGVILHCVFYY